MASIRRSSRIARHRQACFDRGHARIGRHYHQRAFLPEPWGPVDLPVTFSSGHYEQQSAWLSDLVGGIGFVGGPIGVHGPCCGCSAGRGPVRRSPGLPYWQIQVAPGAPAAIAEAVRTEHLSHTAASGTHQALHPEDDFLGPLNCRSVLHETIEQQVREAALAADRAARAEGGRWPDTSDSNERVRVLWRWGHETAIDLGFLMPPLPPEGVDPWTLRRERRAARLLARESERRAGE